MSFQLSSWCQEKVRQEIASATPAEKAIYVRDLKIFNRNRIWQTWSIEEQQWVIKQYELTMTDSAPTAERSGILKLDDGTEIDISGAMSQ